MVPRCLEPPEQRPSGYLQRPGDFLRIEITLVEEHLRLARHVGLPFDRRTKTLASLACGGEAGARPLDNEITLELCGTVNGTVPLFLVCGTTSGMARHCCWRTPLFTFRDAPLRWLVLSDVRFTALRGLNSDITSGPRRATC